MTFPRSPRAEQHGLVTVGRLARPRVRARRQRRLLVDGRRWARATLRVAPARRRAAAGLKPGDGRRPAAWTGAALLGTSACVVGTRRQHPRVPFEVGRLEGHAGRSAARRRTATSRACSRTTTSGCSRAFPSSPPLEPCSTSPARGGGAPSCRGGSIAWLGMTGAAWSLRLVSGSTHHAMLDDLAQRGRPGIRVMRQVLADRPRLLRAPGFRRLESRFAQILARCRAPAVPTADQHR